MVSQGDVINIAIICLESVAVSALWVWTFIKLHNYKEEVINVNPNISKVYKIDPNNDVIRATEKQISQSNTMLPLTAAIASVAVLVSDSIISYFILFPIILSLAVYYVIFSNLKRPFVFAAPREELIERIEPDVMIRRDNRDRKKLLQRFANFHRLKVVGHINFLVAIFSFITGTVISKSFNLSEKNLIFVMFHSLLISYLLAFFAEYVFFKHPHKSQKVFEEIEE